MPRINRVRVANIQYDEGKKQLPDITIDARGLDTVLLLANGGGKTLLVQLILQAVLPNEKMGPRKIADLLQNQKYTGHVVVEWLLDESGQEQSYLCTGFCFTGGRHPDQGLRYFNYCFDYQDLEGLHIQNLPLLQQDAAGMKYPMSYSRLRDLLREEGGGRVQLFDHRLRYQERLRQYQILPEEWKNIRDTNGTEGGVDKFFARSRTTQQLMDNLLIPGVEDMVFQSDSKKKELVHAFGEYRNMLMEIPLIRKNLKDFDAIRDYAEGLVAEVQKLDAISREQSARTRELVALARTFARFEARALEQEEKLAGDRIRQVEALQELRWQQESFAVFEKELDVQRAWQAREACREALLEQEKSWRQAQDEEKQLRALYYYHKLVQARQEVKQQNLELELMDKNQPELKEELKLKKLRLGLAWEKKQERLARRLREQEETRHSLQQENKRLEVEIEACRKRERELQKELARVQVWLEQYYTRQERLLQLVERAEVLDPETALQQRETAFSALLDREGQIHTGIETVRRQQEALEEERSRVQLEHYKTEIQLQGLQQKQAQYEQGEEELRGLLAAHALYTRSLQEEKEKIWSWLQENLRITRENRVTAQARMAALEEKWVLLEDKDYYIPQSELLDVKQHLQQKGIYALLGSEWLAAQPISAVEKEAYIMHQPLLPYALILEQAQLRPALAALKQGRGWSHDLPLLFLVKNEDSLRPGKESRHQLLPLGNQVYCYPNPELGIFTSARELEQYKQELEQQLAGLKEKTRHLVDEEDRYLQIRQKVQAFYRQYPLQQLEDWQELVREHQARMRELDLALEKAAREKEELQQLERQGRQELEEIRGEKSCRQEKMTRLQEYLQEFRLYPARRDEGLQLQDQEREQGLKRESLTREHKDNFEELHRLEQGINENRRLLEIHQNEYRNYGLEKTAGKILVTVAYEELRSEVDAVLEKMKEGQVNRRLVEALLQKAREQEQEAGSIIQDCGVGEQWLKHNQRWVAAAEVKQAEERSREQSREMAGRREELHAAQNTVDAARSVLQERVNRVRDVFGREPFLDFCATHYRHEYKDLLAKQEQLEQELARLEQDMIRNREWLRETREAGELIADKFAAALREFAHETPPLDDRAWEACQSTPRAMVRKSEKVLEELHAAMEGQKRLVERRFQEYLRRLEYTDNPKIKQYIRDVHMIMEEQRIYQYDFVETQFLRIFEGLDRYLEQYQLTLREREKNQQILVDLCLRRARTIYDSIMEIQKNSRVTLYQRDIQVVRMDWRVLEGAEAYQKMHQYLQQVLEDLLRWKQENVDEDELDRRGEELLKTRNLIQVIAPIEDCRIIIYKPRSETVIRHQKIDYSSWDEVCRWSGGEEYSIYITMFMIMITHIRQQITGNRKSWKVIVADNPFGRASSPHVLETVFQVARSNRIQLICLTAHKQDSILQRFPVVYSLQLRHAYGKEVMLAEEMESGFYRYEAQ